MSAQRSIRSYFAATPTNKKNETPEVEELKTEKSASNGSAKLNRTPASTKKEENRKEISTSTPKRKMKNEATPRASKKAKVSPKKRKRVQIDDDDEDETEMEVDDEVQVENETIGSMANSPDITVESTANGSSLMQSMDASEVADEDSILLESDFEHTKLPFLQPDQIQDLNHRKKDDEDYDPSTVFVPASYLTKQTPALRRWWEFKSQNFDKILLFKVGKFYELYHMDAVAAVELLNLAFMKSGADKKAHCGFPEIAFGRFSDQLVQSGYKVARIEQTETPEALEKRNRETPGKKKEKLVRRELCRIITPGTKTYSYIDGDDSQSGTRVLLALCETFDESERRYGVCFVDCAVGKVWISEFDDDYHCSRLRTLLAQYPPAEVLYPKRRLSAATDLLLNGLTQCALQPLAWKSEFLLPSDTLKKVSTKRYFAPDGDDSETSVNDWPLALREAVDEKDLLGSKCKKDYELVVSAFGAITWYLEKCLIDYDILTLKLFEKYEPPGIDETYSENQMTNGPTLPPLSSKTMVLDSAALRNLDVLESSSKPNSTDGTLLELLDSCCTAFGRRLLRYWLCNPLCNVEAIKERQEAIGALIGEKDFIEKASDVLKQMPDLERLLQKVHTMGTKKRLDHPDSRAVFFEAEKYNKRKVDEFLTTLDGLGKIWKIVEEFKAISGNVEARLLHRCLSVDTDGGGRLPNVKKLLKELEDKFNRDRAKKDGVIVIEEDVEAVKRKISKIESDFDAYLKEQRKAMSCSSIKFAQTTGKNRYMLEISDAMASKVKADYKYVGQIKGYKRFLTPFLEGKLKELQETEEELETVSHDSMRRVFEMFSDKGNKWRLAVDCMAILDVLMSLARYAQNSEHPMCVPNVVYASGNQKPFIEIENGYHPCWSKIYTTVDFVPNDTVLGKNDSGSIMLLTGPNMGGKSTLMRQVASLTILAQIGSQVPADSMSLSVVDRIFTRLGACDRLSAGQSTFAVELTETNMILRHATVHSLVVIDELGRGTATHDGAAIAYAVLKRLAEGQLGPRTLFSTHYHSLVTRLRDCGNITLGHMACVKENDTDEDNPSEETITFLYKLAPGSCPKSHGFHAAKIAGISKEIVEAAYAKASEMDRMLEMARRLRTLAEQCQSMTDDELMQAVGSLSTDDSQ